MKKLTGLVLLAMAGMISQVSARDLSNPLPNWIDPSRERAAEQKSLRFPQRAAPPEGFRIPAEYEPVSAVIISWAGYTDMLTSIARAAANQGKADVWGVWAPETISGVPAGQYKDFNIPVDTVWVRDYGPFGLTASGKVGMVDGIYRHYQYRQEDDNMPAALGREQKIEVFGMPLILDGGNLMVDSKGNLYTTKRTYIWNSDKTPEVVDNMLKAHFKVKNVITFEYAGYPGQPRDGTGHIDMFMKLLNDHTVLFSVADTEPFKSNTEKAMAYFRGRTAPDGQPYKIITVKGWENYGTWYTYTNSLIVNNTVLMPSYSSNPQENARAKAAYESGMPGVTVVPINSDSSITSGGSIHCVTQTVPAGPRGSAEAAPAVPAIPFDPAAVRSPALDQLRGEAR